MKRILFIANVDWFFISHRLPIALSLVQDGWDVGIACASTGQLSHLKKSGFNVFETTLVRSGTNVLDELSYMIQLTRIFLKFRPTLVHLITIKPFIYGSLVAWIFKTPKVANISGLGYGLGGQNQSWISSVSWTLIRIAMNLGKSKHFIFQNNDDLRLFVNKKLVSQYVVISTKNFNSIPKTEENYSLIKGVGVNLSEMNYCPPKSKSKLEVIFLGRLLKDKGLLEFFSAANQLKSKYQNQVVFRVYGGLDLENRMAISESELKLHLDSDFIVWEGFTQNVHLAYSEADIVVFPSYREGLPKSLIEAMAIGRPIITTDVPGCRECVVDEYNGFLVPLKEVDPIAVAIEKLINNEQLRVNMGENARKLCETQFNVNEVIKAHKTIYNNLYPI